MTPPGTVHIVDDDVATRESVGAVLTASGFSVRTYASAADFMAQTDDGPGCVVTDIRMPNIDGLELQRRLLNKAARMPVIVMTGFSDIAIAVQAMKNGALDVLEKPFELEDLIAIVNRALAESHRLRDQAAATGEAAARLARLTRREREVFDLLISGLSNKEIASKLGGSPRTVEVHRGRIMEKLDIDSVAGLVRLSFLAAGKEAPS